MRISTNQMQQVGLINILNIQQDLTVQQDHISSGKRIQTPSDDPIGASKSILLKQQISMSQQFQDNAQSAQGRLELSDNILSNITNVLQRVRELSVQGSNDTNGSRDRASIAFELQNRLTEIQGLINSVDGNGEYLYAGFQSTTQPFIRQGNGSYAYVGDDGQLSAEVSAGLSIPVTDSGYALFANVADGNGTFNFQANPANMGTAIINSTSVTNSSSYVADTYTVKFVTNASGQLAYQVVGAASGQLIPALPAVTPADAPQFNAPQTIDFQGHEIVMEGVPVAGDSFTIAQSNNQNILSMIDQIATAMTMTNSTSVESAQFRNALNNSLPALDVMLESVITGRTSVGARLSMLDTAERVNDDFILNAQRGVSLLEDLNLPAAITELEMDSVALEAAQQSFLRIRGLNLFSLLR